MSVRTTLGPIVNDTDVFGADNEAEIVHSGPELVLAYANLRVDCQRIGHALHQRGHDADRWVAATALRLGIPLVSHDGIFKDVPGLLFETVPNGQLDADSDMAPTQLRSATARVWRGASVTAAKVDTAQVAPVSDRAASALSARPATPAPTYPAR